MLKQLEVFIREKNLIKEGDKIIAGVSGGADSVCLLLSLKKLFGEKIELLAVHIHHGLRGEEADRDAAFVKALAERHGISCIERKADVRNFMKEGGFSEEEAGRILRYRIFHEILEERGFHKIAVAHTRDDAAETVLFNLARGSGLSGLCGIKETNGKLIRPLLQTGRAEVEALLFSFHEGYVTDSTNEENKYSRNLIRNILLPKMKEGLNERVSEHIAETAGVVREAVLFIEEKIDEAYRNTVTETEDGFFLKEEAKKEKPLIRSGVVYRMMAEAAGIKKDIERVHVEAISALFLKQVGKKVNLPYGLIAERRYEGIRIGKKKKEREVPPLPLMRTETVEISKIDSINRTEEALILFFENGENKILPQNSCIRWFDYDRISHNAILRTRSVGDYLVISPDGKKKKLKSYFIDRKIPREERDFIPLVASGKNVLWIPGERTGESARIDERTRRLLKIEILKNHLGGEKDECEDQNNDRQ